MPSLPLILIWTRLGLLLLRSLIEIRVMPSGAAPVLSENVDRWALRWLEDRAVTGFYDGPMALGSLEGLLQSDEIVMRIEGPVSEHLRGNVYTRYLRRSWLAM